MLMCSALEDVDEKTVIGASTFTDHPGQGQIGCGDLGTDRLVELRGPKY